MQSTKSLQKYFVDDSMHLVILSISAHINTARVHSEVGRLMTVI